MGVTSHAHSRAQVHASRAPSYGGRGGAADAVCAGLAACSSTPTSDDASPDGPGDAPGASQAAQVDPVRLTTSFTDARSVPIDTPVTVSADGGDLSDVRITSAAGPVEGRVEGGTWTSTSLLEPGTDYRIAASATRSDGEAVERTRAFRTVDLTLDQQTYPSIAPLDGETVGVGMPVVVTFDVPVTDRALFEKHMNGHQHSRPEGLVVLAERQRGALPPGPYWKAGTDVSVDLDLNSLPAGNGIYGQEDRQLSFQVGDAHVYKVNAQTHQMQVFSNGELLRTLPITTGKPGFTTRSGVKVIMEKFDEPPDELRDRRHQPRQPRRPTTSTTCGGRCGSPTPASSSTPHRGRWAPRATPTCPTAAPACRPPTPAGSTP